VPAVDSFWGSAIRDDDLALSVCVDYFYSKVTSRSSYRFRIIYHP
jgi:hypothetical protein